MDSLQWWYGQYLDSKSLTIFLSQNRNKYGKQKKFFELETALIFVRIWETNTLKELMISLPTLDMTVENSNLPLDKIIENRIAFDEDFDINLGLKGKLEELTSLFQIVRVPADVETDVKNLFEFIVKKKFMVPKDENLSLLVRSDKLLRADCFELNQQLKKVNVPYGEIFIVALEPMNRYSSLVYSGYQVFPVVNKFGVVDFKSLSFLFEAF
ncbi:MAG: hypothetical protein MUO78_09965 [candidate division Zixibacteria bacterium]|nr:hypothetical protein [candidate division Zixibacteria bacterium]